MPKMRNTITKKIDWMPDSYIGQFPFELVTELAAPPVIEVAPVVEALKPKKKKATYVAEAIDADGDGRVQDGTIFEREAGTELSPEQVTALEATDSE
jgi:hypothetical protein